MDPTPSKNVPITGDVYFQVWCSSPITTSKHKSMQKWPPSISM